MATRYVAIDTETSGTDPARHQVLEFAAVLETDWHTPVEELPHLHLLVDHGEIGGDPVALHMNARLIAEFAKPVEERSVETAYPEELGRRVREFLAAHFGPLSERGSRATVAGKNCGTFDLRFLERHPGWPADRIRHRVLDVGCLWWEPATDDRLPDTAECFRRAGLAGAPAHCALADARAVVKLVRRAYARDRFPAPVPRLAG